MLSAALHRSVHRVSSAAIRSLVGRTASRTAQHTATTIPSQYDLPVRGARGGIVKEKKKMKATVKDKVAKSSKQRDSSDSNDPNDILHRVRISDMEARMDSMLLKLTETLSAIRIGRASPTALDHVSVLAYGKPTQLKDLGQVSVRQSHTLVVSLFDPSLAREVERAIRQSAQSLGSDLLPSVDADGKVTVTYAKSTRETRDAMVKQVSTVSEESKTSVRNVRQETLQRLKNLGKEVSEDDSEYCREEIQNITDGRLVEILMMVKAKEKELNTE